MGGTDIAAGRGAPSGRVHLPDLFVSDVHLSTDRPVIQKLFGAFLRSQAAKARALYILGDLLDYWIGDDDLGAPFHTEIVADLAAVSRSGCVVYLMHGNRDFLFQEGFAQAAGAQLLADPSVIDQAGTRTLLLHGDTLCLDDPDYQAFRSKVRAEHWQRDFLSKPLTERRAIALQLRDDSRSSQQRKPDAIMDVAATAVVDAFKQHRCTRMIHGHTHRPARHDYVVDGRRCERWVLGDWYETGSFLRCDARGVCETVPWSDGAAGA